MIFAETCVICQDNKPDRIGYSHNNELSCRHCCLCNVCAERILSSENRECPLCKKYICYFKDFETLSKWELIVLSSKNTKNLQSEIIIIKSMFVNT